MLNNILIQGRVSINNKIYGGILSALDTVDEALRLCGEPILYDRYCEDVQFFGKEGVGKGRIDTSGKYRGLI